MSRLSNAGGPIALLRYEDLIADAAKAAADAVASLMLPVTRVVDAAIPRFHELQAIDPAFFRRGVVGSYRDEMPAELHDLFWAQPENAAAMRLVGYGERERHAPPLEDARASAGVRNLV